MGCLQDVNDRCGLRYVFHAVPTALLGDPFANRPEMMLDRLAPQGSDDPQSNGAGDQAPGGEKQEQSCGLLDMNAQCRGHGAK